MFIRLLVLLLFMIPLLGGCYTVIKHPEVFDRENSNYRYEVYFSDNCQQCHTNPADNLFYKERINPLSLNYIQNNERWNHFYQSPWWTKDIFYTGPEQNEIGNENNPLPTTSARRRFPGVNSNVGEGSSANVTSGNNAGSSTRVTNSSRKNKDSDSPPESGSNRQKRENQNVRKVDRESKKSDSDSKSSDKAKK